MRGVSSQLVEVIAGDIEVRHVDAFGNNLDRTGGWCLQHEDFAWRFDDNLISCFHQQITESDTSDCRWVSLSRFLGAMSQ